MMKTFTIETSSRRKPGPSSRSPQDPGLRRDDSVRGRVVLASALLVLMLFTASPAHACAVLEKADPRVGHAISGPLDAVTLYFSMKVYPADSTMTVTDTDGHPVSLGKPFGDAKDDTVMKVRLNSLQPGKYKVSWTVHADCGSYEPGDFKFTVDPPGTQAAAPR
jgi:methionine-rich copper-binding protein CopC